MPMHVDQGLYIVRQVRDQRLSLLAGVPFHIEEDLYDTIIENR